MSSREFAGWKAFYHLEPFGDNIRLMALIAMVCGNWKRTPKLDDVLAMVGHEQAPPAKPDKGTLRAKTRAFFGAFGKKLKRKDEA